MKVHAEYKENRILVRNEGEHVATISPRVSGSRIEYDIQYHGGFRNFPSEVKSTPRRALKAVQLIADEYRSSRENKKTAFQCLQAAANKWNGAD